jgi:hypothetical protein
MWDPQSVAVARQQKENRQQLRKRMLQHTMQSADARLRLVTLTGSHVHPDAEDYVEPEDGGAAATGGATGREGDFQNPLAVNAPLSQKNKKRKGKSRNDDEPREIEFDGQDSS